MFNECLKLSYKIDDKELSNETAVTLVASGLGTINKDAYWAACDQLAFALFGEAS